MATLDRMDWSENPQGGYLDVTTKYLLENAGTPRGRTRRQHDGQGTERASWGLPLERQRLLTMTGDDDPLDQLLTHRPKCPKQFMEPET
jgi:hypothetical protein